MAALDGVLRSVVEMRAGLVQIVAVAGAGKTTIMRDLLTRWPVPEKRGGVDLWYSMRYPGIRYFYPGRLGHNFEDLRGGGLLGVDEADRVATRGKKAWQWILDAANCCRNLGVTMAWTARDPVAAQYELANLSRLWIVGYQPNKDHLRALLVKRPDAWEIIRRLDPGKERERCGQFAVFKLW